MADSPSFQDARAELTPDSVGNNNQARLSAQGPNGNPSSRRQLFTQNQDEAHVEANEVDNDVSVAVVVEGTNNHGTPRYLSKKDDDYDSSDAEEELKDVDDGDSRVWLGYGTKVVVIRSIPRTTVRSRVEVPSKIQRVPWR